MKQKNLTGGIQSMTKEESIWEWRQKLRPYISEVINRLNEEENRRNLYAQLIRERKENSKLR